MSSQFLHISNLHFTYEQSNAPLFENFSLSLASGWTVVAGANGSGKSTLLKLIAGMLHPQEGAVSGPGASFYCPQELFSLPPGLAELYEDLYSGLSHAGKLFSLLEMDHDWPYRWESLSFGERKRAQIAAAINAEPEILLLDEPANHLDDHGRGLLRSALEDYRGIGVLVSHDRELMDGLCSRTLLLGDMVPRYFSCNWSRAEEEMKKELDEARLQYHEARKEERRLSRELQRRRELNDRHRKDFSKKGLDSKDHDAKGRIDQARVTGRDAIGGRLVKAMDARLQRHNERIVPVAGEKRPGVSFISKACRSDSFITIPAGSLNLGGHHQLQHPELSIRPGERIALTGRNGSGKTSLINMLLASWPEEGAEFLYMPQEIDPSRAQRLLESFNALENDERGEVLSHFTRLLGQADSLLNQGIPSPGELRKLALAMGFFRESPLLIMDEPGNHLDLPSISAIEEALCSYDGALLLVSHDSRFRQALCTSEWRIRREEGRLELEIV